MLASVEVHVARIVIFGNFGGTSKDKPDFHYSSGDTALCGCSSNFRRVPSCGRCGDVSRRQQASKRNAMRAAPAIVATQRATTLMRCPPVAPPVQRSSRVISLRRLAFLHSIAVLVRSQIEPRSDLSERVTGFVVPGDRTATAAGMCIPRSQKLRPGSEHSSASDATCSMSEKTPRFPACRPGQRLSSRQDQRVRHRWRLTRHR